MSKDQKDDYLRYGQGILIQGFTSDKEEDQGFLSAKGFADTTAKYETYKDILYFKNYRNAIFQIIPAANFQLNDQLRKLQEITTEENTNYKILVARSKSQEDQFNILRQKYIYFYSVSRNQRFVLVILLCSNMSTLNFSCLEQSVLPMAPMVPLLFKLPRVLKKF